MLLFEKKERLAAEIFNSASKMPQCRAFLTDEYLCLTFAIACCGLKFKICKFREAFSFERSTE